MKTFENYNHGLNCFQKKSALIFLSRPRKSVRFFVNNQQKTQYPKSLNFQNELDLLLWVIRPKLLEILINRFLIKKCVC